jgi:hypothetical protein
MGPFLEALAPVWPRQQQEHFVFVRYLTNQHISQAVKVAMAPLHLGGYQIKSSFISTAHFRHGMQHNVLHRKKQ